MKIVRISTTRPNLGLKQNFSGTLFDTALKLTFYKHKWSWLLERAGPGGSPLHKQYRVCDEPKGVVFGSVWSESGYRHCPFWSCQEIGYDFPQNYGSVWTYLLFQFQMNEKESRNMTIQKD